MIFCVLKRHAKWSNLTRPLSYQDPMKASIATTRSMPKSSVHSITRYLVMTSKHIDQCPIYLQSIKVMIFGRYKLRNSDTFIWPHDRTMCNCSKKILLFCYKITFHCHENCIRLKYFKYFEWKWKSATIFVQKWHVIWWCACHEALKSDNPYNWTTLWCQKLTTTTITPLPP